MDAKREPSAYARMTLLENKNRRDSPGTRSRHKEGESSSACWVKGFVVCLWKRTSWFEAGPNFAGPRRKTKNGKRGAANPNRSSGPKWEEGASIFGGGVHRVG